MMIDTTTPHDEEQALFDALLNAADERNEREQQQLPRGERDHLFGSQRERRAWEQS